MLRTPWMNHSTRVAMKAASNKKSLQESLEASSNEESLKGSRTIVDLTMWPNEKP